MINGDAPPGFYIVPSIVVARRQKGACSMPEFRLVDAKQYQGKWSASASP